MRFLVDANLPTALARSLTAHGQFAEHVADCGLATAKDGLIWDAAVTSSAVIVTRDEDFATRRMMRGDGPQVVWVRHPNIRRRDLVAWFAAILPQLLRILERGEAVIEITHSSGTQHDPTTI